MNRFLLVLLSIFLGFLLAYFTNEESGSNGNTTDLIKSESFNNERKSKNLWDEISSIFSFDANSFTFDSQEDRKKYVEAIKLYENEKFDESFILFKQLSDFYSDFDSLFLYAAISAVNIEKFDTAAYFFNQTLEINAENVEANIAYAKLLNDEMKQYNNAEYYAELALEYEPSSVPAYIELAKANFNMGYLVKADLNVENAFNYDSLNPYLYFIKGQIFDLKNDFDSAFYFYRKAIEYDENFGQAYVKMGSLNFNAEYYYEAIKWYNKAILKVPDLKYVYLQNIGLSFANLEKMDSAFFYYSKSIEINPNYYLVYYNRGFLYKSLNNKHKALNDFKTCIDLNTEYSPAYTQRGVMYFEEKDYIQALNDFYSAFEFDPFNDYAVYNIAITQDALENYEDALEMYKKYIKMGANIQMRDYATSRIEKINAEIL